MSSMGNRMSWKCWGARVFALSLAWCVASTAGAVEPMLPPPPPPPPSPVGRVRPPPPPRLALSTPARAEAAVTVQAEGPREGDEVIVLRDDTVPRQRQLEHGLIAGSLGALVGSIALQAWTFATVRAQCIRPLDGGEVSSLAVRECISGRGGLAAAGTLSALLGATSVGMAAGTGWLRGRKLPSDQRRGHRVAGGLLVAAGLGGLIVSGLSVHLGAECKDVSCLESQRVLSTAGRGASLTMLAAGGGLLAATAR